MIYKTLHRKLKTLGIPIDTNCAPLLFDLFCFFIRTKKTLYRGFSRKIKKSLKTPTGYKNPYIEEEQKTQWPKEKVQKDKQLSTKHIHKTKDRVTRTALKTGGELRFSRRISSSCPASGTCRVTLFASPMTSQE
jgi:hypothetical protein